VEGSRLRRSKKKKRYLPQYITPLGDQPLSGGFQGRFSPLLKLGRQYQRGEGPEKSAAHARGELKPKNDRIRVIKGNVKRGRKVVTLTGKKRKRKKTNGLKEICGGLSALRGKPQMRKIGGGCARCLEPGNLLLKGKVEKD